jgi:hypothetical protein
MNSVLEHLQLAHQCDIFNNYISEAIISCLSGENPFQLSLKISRAIREPGYENEDAKRWLLQAFRHVVIDYSRITAPAIHTLQNQNLCYPEEIPDPEDLPDPENFSDPEDSSDPEEFSDPEDSSDPEEFSEQ